VGLLTAVLVLPLLFALVAAYAVVKVAALMLRIAFAPVVWLSNRPPRQWIEVRQ
jgi:hypothetical protein